MSQKVGKNNNKVYRLVLTGGPCGGKTTGQARLCTFFENLGWKVYRVPETATVLIGGGVKWSDMGEDETFRFQENLIKTMKQIEDTFFDLAASTSQNCLVICDRGTMDASAYLKPEQWEVMKVKNGWNNVDLRDSRYNQVIHMVSAAKGAEPFYKTDSHITRYEGVELAKQLDDLTSQAWVGHPYYDVMDNTTDFERKIVRMIATVCQRLGVNPGDRLALDSKKRKFVVGCLPAEHHFDGMITADGYIDEAGGIINNVYPQFQDFIVVHDYLVTPNSKMQARIRRRGQNVKWDAEKGRWDIETDPKPQDANVYHLSLVRLDADSPKIERENKSNMNVECFMYGTDHDISNWTYTHTIRRPEINKEAPELKMQISSREYELLLAQKDGNHNTIYKKRRCFLWNNQYFQMDIYQEPCHPRCKDLIILETYTTLKGNELKLPDFLEIEREVTTESKYSMYNLSKKELASMLASSLSPTVNGNHAKLVSSQLEGMAKGPTKGADINRRDHLAEKLLSDKESSAKKALNEGGLHEKQQEPVDERNELM